MKHLFFLIACIALFISPVICQAQTDTAKATIVQTVPTIAPAAPVQLPATPGAGSTIFDWFCWVLSVGLAFDAVYRLIPTSGRFSWVTKTVGVLHDFLLWLDLQKKNKA